MYDTDTDPFDSPEGQALFRRVTVLAQQHFPDTWKEMAYITQATGFILANGWTTLEQAHLACPQGLRRILTESGIVSCGQELLTPTGNDGSESPAGQELLDVTAPRGTLGDLHPCPSQV